MRFGRMSTEEAAAARSDLGLNAVAAFAFRNRLRNGNLSINQRGSPSSSTSYAAGAYVLDGWKAGASGATLSWSIASNGCDAIVTITAGSLLQVVPSDALLEGGRYLLSWQGSAPGRSYQGTASGSYAAGPVATSPSAASPLSVEFGPGSLVLPQLEPGAAATVFERLPQSIELIRCQRIYQRLFLSLRNKFGGPDDVALILPVQMSAKPTVALVAAGSRANLDSSYPPSVSMADGQSGRFEIVTLTSGQDGYALFDLWSFSAEP